MNGYGATYSIIVVCAEVRMVPVEAVLIVQGETVCEVASGHNSILFRRSANFTQGWSMGF
jgi:hypothetical protein